MRAYSIQDIIKAIPLDKEVRADLLTNYDSYDEGKQFEISQICWDAFTKLEKALKEAKYQQFLAEVEEGKRELSPNMMDEVEEAVSADIEDIIAGKKAETDQLDTVRDELQQLIHTTQSQS